MRKGRKGRKLARCARSRLLVLVVQGADDVVELVDVGDGDVLLREVAVKDRGDDAVDQPEGLLRQDTVLHGQMIQHGAHLLAAGLAEPLLDVRGDLLEPENELPCTRLYNTPCTLGRLLYALSYSCFLRPSL